MDIVEIAGGATFVLMILSNIMRLWLLTRRLSDGPLVMSGRRCRK